MKNYLDFIHINIEYLFRLRSHYEWNLIIDKFSESAYDYPCFVFIILIHLFFFKFGQILRNFKYSMMRCECILMWRFFWHFKKIKCIFIIMFVHVLCIFFKNIPSYNFCSVFNWDDLEIKNYCYFWIRYVAFFTQHQGFAHIG